MNFPLVSQTIAYNGKPSSVLGYPVIADRPHIELVSCPGPFHDPHAGVEDVSAGEAA